MVFYSIEKKKTRVMKTLITCIACFFAMHLWAQSGTVNVHKDGRLDILNDKQASINKLASKFTSSGLYRGYRLQVLSTQSRDQAYQLKAELLQRFPEQKTYTLYQSPYFKVRFGNFTEKGEAMRYKNMLASMYPQGIYLIQDNVEYMPKEEDAE